MTLQISAVAEKGYVSLVRTGAMTYQTSRKNWRKLGSVLRETGLRSLLADCREARLELSIIEADDLAKELKQELQRCSRIAVVTTEAESPVMRHFCNVCLCLAIDVALFSDLASAERWLCQDGTPQTAP